MTFGREEIEGTKSTVFLQGNQEKTWIIDKEGY